MKKFLKAKWNLLIEEIKSEPIKELIKNVLYIILGSFLLAIGVELFIVPMKIVAGGSSSLALIFASIKNNKISVENYITIIYWVCFAIGLFTLGIRYSLKTLIVTISNPLFIYLLDFIIDKVVINNMQVLSLNYWAENTINIASTDITGEINTLICLLLAVIIGPF